MPSKVMHNSSLQAACSGRIKLTHDVSRQAHKSIWPVGTDCYPTTLQTLQQTPLKVDGWKMDFLGGGWPYFQGRLLLVSERV